MVGCHVRCEQRWETHGIVARHAALGGYAVDPGMAPGGGEASAVAGHVANRPRTGLKALALVADCCAQRRDIGADASGIDAKIASSQPRRRTHVDAAA
jgi:hypothetical protein